MIIEKFDPGLLTRAKTVMRQRDPNAVHREAFYYDEYFLRNKRTAGELTMRYFLLVYENETFEAALQTAIGDPAGGVAPDDDREYLILAMRLNRDASRGWDWEESWIPRNKLDKTNLYAEAARIAGYLDGRSYWREW